MIRNCSFDAPFFKFLNFLQVIGLKEHQLKWLCNHLGHTRKLHETHYRATSGLIERVKIAKLLLIQENNMAGQFAGQDLSEIQFEGWLFSQEFTSRGLSFFFSPFYTCKWICPVLTLFKYSCVIDTLSYLHSKSKIVCICSLKLS